MPDLTAIAGGSPPAPLSASSEPLRQALVDLGRRYGDLGWLLGTSGNLSARFARDDGRPAAVVTASGRHKARLDATDFVEVDLDGELLAAGPDARPSAEASIHLAIYRRVPRAAYALHVHTVASTRLNAPRPATQGRPAVVAFTGVEMIKGYGLWDEGDVARLPVFDNHADVARIAAEVYEHLAAPDPIVVPALVVRGHGITAWGETAFDADRHLEVTEFLCRLATA